jgi:hypothetical protein
MDSIPGVHSQQDMGLSVFVPHWELPWMSVTKQLITGTIRSVITERNVKSISHFYLDPK